MGASKKLGRHKRCPKEKAGNKEKKSGDAEGVGDDAVKFSESSSLLPCVAVLFNSSNYRELLECCGDLGLYATDCKYFPTLVASGVPTRLGELLSRLPLDHSALSPSAQEALANATPNVAHPLQNLHQGIIDFQVAAAGALRNFITNSSSDEVMDALTAYNYVGPNGENMTYTAVLLSHVFNSWKFIQELHSYILLNVSLLSVCTDDMEKEEGEPTELDGVCETQAFASAPEERQARRSIRLYFSLLVLLEQLYQLALVSIDGSEEVANDFSQPRVATEVLRQIEVCVTETENIMSREPSVFSTTEKMGATGELERNFCFYRREALLLTNVATAAGDTLQTLSTDNALLSSSLSELATDGEVGVTAMQRSWLDSVVVGASCLSWMKTQAPSVSAHSSCFAAENTPPASGVVASNEICPSCNSTELLELENEFVHHQLLRFTLSIQGTLVNLFPSADNISRALPLSVQVLSTFMPIQQWRQVLPLLEDCCEISEGIRSMLVRITTSRLRAAKTAIEVLHGCVTFIGEQNEDHLEDEDAFEKNPLSVLLYQSNALHVVGCVLKDALWMMESAEASNVDALRRSEQRALRLTAASNSEVTLMQFVILTTEVGVWQLGNTLLLMVSPASLGELSVIWRSMVSAVRHRTDLLSNAAAQAVNNTAVNRTQNLETTDTYASAAEVYTIAAVSPAARHMLWLQLKSLVQILWTLARKQSALQQSYLDCANSLGAEPLDLDLLTRLVWEKDCPYTVSQACVATVGFLAASFQQPISVRAAAASAQALLTRVGGPLSLAELEDGVIQTNPPTNARERHTWLSRLQRADEIVSVRCEAANTLIDLFSDERYDLEVYLPLRIQQSLQVFFHQLRQHITLREWVGKTFWKNYRVKLALPAGFSVWAEVKDNLEGFLPYKKAHANA